MKNEEFGLLDVIPLRSPLSPLDPWWRYHHYRAMRIIGGVARGHKIRAPKGKSTRPTTDRVREALFSTLTSIFGSFEGLHVLDLFAGSGSLGLEAVSRGADHAVFVDWQRSCQQVIYQNAQALGFQDKCRILPMKFETALELFKKQRQAFHLIFVDPPYRYDPDPLLAALIQGEILLAQGILSFESGKRSPPREFESLELIKYKIYGDTFLSIYKRR